LLILQISDTHCLVPGQLLAGHFDTSAALERLVESLSRQPVRPDVILHSGDLGENATRAEYAHIGSALRSLGAPVLAVPGNHDAREPLLAELPEMVGKTSSGHLCQVNRDFPLAILGLDTLVEGAPHGELCKERLAWLETQLDALAGQRVLIFMHHPPIRTGFQDMDRMGLLHGGPELEVLIARHGQVQAVLCGHMHRAIQGSIGGAPVRVAPSASHQIAFDLRPSEPYRLTAEPPQYMMHLWAGETLVSHSVFVEGAD